jgi:hypothetical protein
MKKLLDKISEGGGRRGVLVLSSVLCSLKVLPLSRKSHTVGELANLTQEIMRKRRQSPTCVSRIAPCKK